MFSIDEKKILKVTEKVRNCDISIYALIRNLKNHIAGCFNKVFVLNFFPKLTFIIKNLSSPSQNVLPKIYITSHLNKWQSL